MRKPVVQFKASLLLFAAACTGSVGDVRQVSTCEGDENEA